MIIWVARKAGLVLAAAALSFAADDSRPECNARMRGRMWPDAANHDPKLFSKLARCGQLEICVHGNWHYHWESATVRIDQLRRGAAKQNPAGCDAQPELTNEESGRLSSASK